ncbi:PIN2/TERF1-interacting telomerase inhibitor 1, partial [Frankliniella fusca]
GLTITSSNMAMLAEKRTKTRYYLHHKALNPRGNAWCEDSSKFGQRMLEKMGWSQGKGLGANEDGSTDPVTVSYKWDSKGMGYKGADGDEAVAQQKDFDALLATLSQNNSPDGKSTAPHEKSPKSLELMSQKSRARVHYHKFTRGKDLSRASSKDLASILGMATEMKTSAPVSPGPLLKPDVGPPIEQNMVTTFGITTIARGNINEYFKQKYEERKRKLIDCESEEDGIRSQISNDTAILTVTRDVDESLDDNPELERVNIKKKKKKKNKAGEGNEIDCNSSSALDDTIQGNSDPSSAKSRRKSVTWGDVEVSFVSKYIKDMADTSSESVNGDSDLFVSDDIVDQSVTNSKKKKKKDRKKSKELSCELIEQKSEVDEVLDESNSTFQKKKKKSKQVLGDTEEGISCEADDVSSSENFDSNVYDAQNSATDATQTKKKNKKKKKKKSCDDLVGNVSSSESTESSEAGVANTSNPKKQKKKKVKDVLEDFVSHSNEGPLSEDPQVSSKKKKKQKVKETICDNDTASGKIDKSTKKRKMSENEEKISDGMIAENPVPEEFSETKQKKRRNEEMLETDGCKEIKLYLPESNDAASVVSLNIDKDEKVKKKKKRKSLVFDADNNSVVGNDCVDDSNEQPALSALTQERMAKWKSRKKSSNAKTSSEELISESSKTEKLRTARIEYNPNQPTQDYNHRKVLSTLGYNVKGANDKTISVRMPESNFAGSNLDVIPGYGQTIKSC